MESTSIRFKDLNVETPDRRTCVFQNFVPRLGISGFKPIKEILKEHRKLMITRIKKFNCHNGKS